MNENDEGEGKGDISELFYRLLGGSNWRAVMDDSRRSNTEKFLAELLSRWQFEKELAASDDPGVKAKVAELEAKEAEIAAKMGPFDETVHEGEIRVFDPDIWGDDAEVRFVLVVRDWLGDGSIWLVQPFSEFDHPGMPSEVDAALHLGADLPPRMKILQGWLTHTLTAETLKRSWVVSSDSDEVRKQLAFLGQYAFKVWMGSADPDWSTGAPVGHRDDPRWEYQEKELGYWANLWIPDHRKVMGD